MMLDAGRDYDPADFSRTLIKEQSGRAERYAGILAELIDMRDDDGAEVIRRRLIASVNEISAQFKALASARATQPAQDAQTYFDRLPVKEAS